MQQVAQFHLAPFNPDTVRVERGGRLLKAKSGIKATSKGPKRVKVGTKGK